MGKYINCKKLFVAKRFCVVFIYEFYRKMGQKWCHTTLKLLSFGVNFYLFPLTTFIGVFEETR